MAFQLKNIPNKEAQQSKSFDLNKLLQKEITLFSKGFSSKKKEAFYNELSVLLEADVSLKESLSLISEGLKSPYEKQLISEIIENLIAGKSFSESIAIGNQFSEYEYHSIKIGEETGALQKITHSLAAYYKNKNLQRRNLIGALSYPIIVVFTAIMAVLFMLHFVVPMFADIFKQHNVSLPWLTKVVLGASKGLQNNFWILFLLFVALTIALKKVSKKVFFKKTMSKVVLKIPFLSSFLKMVYLSQFTQAMALLSNAKVPILKSIQLTQKMIDFYPLQKALKAIENDILEGKYLSESIKEHAIFDKKMGSLIQVAEQTNKTALVFEKLNTQYSNDVQHQSKALNTALEPLIIILLGGVVGLILVSMYLPMFKLSTAMG